MISIASKNGLQYLAQYKFVCKLMQFPSTCLPRPTRSVAVSEICSPNRNNEVAESRAERGSFMVHSTRAGLHLNCNI